MPVGPTLIKELERINVVMARNPLLEQVGKEEELRRNSYIMNVNRERNCYSCREFGNLVRNCRNKSIIGQERRIEHKNNENTRNNLKEEENLVVLS